MKKIKYLVVMLIFALFSPKVYAFTYEIDTSVNTTSVKVGTVQEIKVSLKNIQGTNKGIIGCTLDIKLSDNIIMDSDIRTLNSWSMTHGKFYLFDTGSSVKNSSDMFIIPVKVNGDGTVNITDITCSEVDNNVSVTNKNISFTVKNEVSNNNGNDSSNTENKNNKEEDKTSNNEKEEDKSNVQNNSNCDLTDIILSEGSINFNSSITEYSIHVKNINDLKITPVLADSNAEYIIDKNIGLDGKNNITITVNAKDGNKKIYTIYVDEDGSANDEDNKVNYIPIFIGIILILVLVNVVRIINSKKKKLDDLN